MANSRSALPNARRRAFVLKGLLWAFLMVFLPGTARSNHYLGGDITYRCLGAGQYEITLDLFLDCSNAFGIIKQGIHYENDCGASFIDSVSYSTVQEVSQLCAAALPQSSCNGGTYRGVRAYQFKDTVSLGACNDWTIWWSICCRGAMVNLTGGMGMYLEATVNTALVPCDDSPVFAEQSLPYVCVNQPVLYNFGVNDPDGDSVSYRLINARYYGGAPTSVTYNAGYTGAVPVPGIQLDVVNGQVVFTPGAIGSYVIAIEIEQFDAAGNSIGTVMRDVTFVVLACTGSVPTMPAPADITGPGGGPPPAGAVITGNNSVDACAGTAFCFHVRFTDPDPGTILQVTTQAATLLPGSTVNVVGNNPTDVTICWTADPNNSPVNLLIQASDGACPVENTTAVAVNITSSVNNGPVDPGNDGNLNVCTGGPTENLFNSLGGTPDPNGYWLGPTNAPHSGQFTPGTDAAGVYTYVAGNACGTATATVTVTVSNGGASPGTNGTLPVCANAAAQPLINGLGGTPTAGGTWTGPGNVPHGPTYDPVVDAPGVYTYTIAGGCGSGSAQVTMSEIAPPDAGTNGTLTLCSNSLPVALAASLGGTPAAGGTWRDPANAVHGATYDPAVDGPGVYTYTVNGTSPCANAVATVTVTENPGPNAGQNGALPICSTGASTPLINSLGGTPTAGGTWTLPGNVPHGPNYDPATDAPAVFTYTVTAAGCPSASATVNVTEPTAPSAGTNGTLVLCSTSPSAALMASLGGTPAAGGTWTAPGNVAHGPTYDPAVDGPGVYTYTVNGAPPCANATATVTVTENPGPDAGIDGTLDFCSDATAAPLVNGLGGTPAAGGTWTAPGNVPHGPDYDPAVDGPGTYTYTVGGCGNATATVTVTENAPPSAGADITVNVCSNGAAIGLFGQLTGAQAGGNWTDPGGAAFGGSYDPAVDAPGVYTYTVSGTGACGNADAQVTVVVHAAPMAGNGATPSFCSSDAPVNLFTLLGGSPAAGGTWTGPGGVPFSGTYDPAVDGPGAYTYTVSGTAPCVNDVAVVTVSETTAPYAGANANVSTCSNGLPTALFPSLVGADAGGTWTGPGPVPFSGTYDPATDGPGVYTYTLGGTGACSGGSMATVTVTENTAPSAGASTTMPICSNGAPLALFPLLAGAAAGGTWTAPGGAPHSGTYDPSVDVAGTYTYEVTAAGPCLNVQATVGVTETTAAFAGTDAGATFCSNDPAGALALSLPGADPGGIWTDPNGDPHNGIYDPASDVPGAYTYAVAGPAPCGNDAAVVTVSETTVPFAGADAPFETICSANAPTNMFLVYLSTSGAVPGGTWTDPFGVPFPGLYDPAVHGSGVYTYTAPAIPGCAADQAQVTMLEGQAPDAGTDVPNVPICANAAPLALFPLLAGADPGGSWSGPGGSPFNGVYDPAVDASGVYTYSLPPAPPCVGSTATVTVTEQPLLDPGTPTTVTICDQGPVQDLFTLLGGTPDAGGQWRDPANAAHSNLYDPAVDAPGFYTYEVGGPPCGTLFATVEVLEEPFADAGTDNAITLCSNAAPEDLFTDLGGTPDAGGTWAGPGGTPHSNVFDPATDTPGPYVYTVGGAGNCPAVSATVIVTLETAPEAGGNGSTTVCNAGGPVDLFGELTGTPDAGGQWSDPGGSTHSNLYDPAVDGPGVYTYTVTGSGNCVPDQATVTVLENASPNAGNDGVVQVCTNGTPIGLFGELTGTPDLGGSWTAPDGTGHSGTFDPATDAAGVYTYTIPATFPCVSSSAIVTVTLETAPEAGDNGSTTVCNAGGPVDLFGELTGTPDVGGQWSDPGGSTHSNLYDPAVDGPGVYTYTVSGSGNCVPDQATVTVLENASPNAGNDGVVQVCTNGTPIGLFGELTGTPDLGGSWTAPDGTGHSGTFDPAADAAGIYTYTIPATTPCVPSSATVTVTLETAPEAGGNGSTTVCNAGGPVDLFGELTGTPDAGGQWSDPGGSTHSNLYDPTVDGPGVYTYTVTGSGNCVPDQATVTVLENASPNAGGDGTAQVCTNGTSLNLFNELTGTPDLGGSWTAPDGTGHSGIFDPATDAAGIYTYTIPATTPCVPSSATVTVTLETAPEAGGNGSTTVCNAGGPVDLFGELTGTPDVGGQWSDPGGSTHSNLYDPAVDGPGVYTYTVSGSGNCVPDQATVTVLENASPNAGNDGVVQVCTNGTPIGLFGELTGTPDLGGSWTAPDGTGHSGTFDPATDAAGVYTYTIPATFPCVSSSAIVTVTLETAPEAGAGGDVFVCDLGAAIDLFSALSGADAGGFWRAPDGSAHTNLYDPAVDGPGLYTYTVAGTLPCLQDQATVDVHETGTPDAGLPGSIDLCSSGAAVDLFASLGGSPESGGSWTAPDGSGHGNFFDPAVDAPGLYTYTISATTPCSDASATVTVTLETAPEAGTGGDVFVCDLSAAIDLFSALSGADAGGFWRAPDGSAHTNLYDPAVDGPGLYTYTVAGTLPCLQDQATVDVHETGTPNAGLPGGIDLCSSGAAVDLFASLGGSPESGGSWTAPDGSGHGNLFDPAVDAPGLYTYTISATAPCSDASATVTVNVEAAHDAGTSAQLDVCTGDAPFTLTSTLAGTPDAGGAWTFGNEPVADLFDPATSTAGTYTYSFDGITCPDVSSTVQIGVLAGPNAGQDNAVVFCSSDAPVALLAQLNGTPDATGSWTGPDGLSAGPLFDPAVSLAGVYVYMVAGNLACSAATAEVTLGVSEALSAGTIGISTLCSTSGTVDLFDALGSTADPGGTWTGPGNIPFDGTYDPAVDLPGVYTYTVDAADPCPTVSAGITVEVNEAPDAGLGGAEALCDDGFHTTDLISLLGGTPDTEGTWTDPAGLASDGTFTPGTSQPGTYTYRVEGTAPCAAAVSQLTMSVVQPADAGSNGAIALCSNEAPFGLLAQLNGTPDANGTWTGPDGSTVAAVLDPATAQSGAYTYTVTPQQPCFAVSAVVMVDITPVPALDPSFTLSGGCVPVEVTFTSGYTGPGTCHWDFGNDSTSNACGPVTMTYAAPGSWSVSFTADPGNGCAATVELSQPVVVADRPTAAFAIVADGIHTQDPIAAFDNQSAGAGSYLWQFGELGTSTEEDLQYVFPYDVEATYPVCLIAYATPTCSDTLCQDLFVPAGSAVFTPNAFTPDGDGHNDGFAPVTRALRADEYRFYIFDRWGQPLYATEDPQAKWDGTYRNGSEVPQGVYVWKLTGMDAVTGERFEELGHVSLLR